MSHTKEESKKLWCPMTRVALISEKKLVQMGQTVFNRLAGEDGSLQVSSASLCIADHCAMWRWNTHLEAPEGVASHLTYPLVKRRSRTGYCGLAGRQEVYE